MEEFSEWIAEVEKENKPIIVEGQKDENSLRELGIKNPIYRLNKPIYQVVETIAGHSKEVIILTDFDKKGKQLYGRLKKNLQRLGVEIDNKVREWLQKNTRLSHIEGLCTYINNQK